MHCLLNEANIGLVLLTQMLIFLSAGHNTPLYKKYLDSTYLLS